MEKLYVRSESDEDVITFYSSPKKSTSLSSLRNLRDTFKRSESRTSQTSLASSSKIEPFDNTSDTISTSVLKPCEYNISRSVRMQGKQRAVHTSEQLNLSHKLN